MLKQIQNLFVCAGMLMLMAQPFCVFAMTMVVEDEPIASSSYKTKITARAETSPKYTDITQKINTLLKTSFDEAHITLLKENKDTNEPAIISPEILTFLQEIEESIPQALAEGDKLFEKKPGYQEDLKVKLLIYLETFAKEYIPDLKDAEKKIQTIKGSLEKKENELSSLNSSENKDEHLTVKITAKKKECTKLLVELKKYSVDISLYQSRLKISDEEVSTQKEALAKTERNLSEKKLESIEASIETFKNKKNELKLFLTTDTSAQIKELQERIQKEIERLQKDDISRIEKGLPEDIKETQNLAEKIQKIKEKITETEAKIEGPKGDEKGKKTLQEKVIRLQTKLKELQAIAKNIQALEQDKTNNVVLAAQAQAVPKELNNVQHSLESKKRDYNRELKKYFTLEDTHSLYKSYIVEMNEQERADSMVVGIRGKLYELQAALAAVAHGKNIKAFGQEIRLTFKKDSAIHAEIKKHTKINKDDKDPNHFLSPEDASNDSITLKQEFDLITDSEIIECKSTSWNVAQYIQNLNRQRFIITHMVDASKIEIIGEDKKPRNLSPEETEWFKEKSIICFVKFIAKRSTLVQKKADHEEISLINQGFTLWNGETYQFALKIIDPYSEMPSWKEILDLKKQIQNIGQEKFILHIIAPKKHLPLIEDRLKIFGIVPKQELYENGRRRSNSMPTKLLHPKQEIQPQTVSDLLFSKIRNQVSASAFILTSLEELSLTQPSIGENQTTPQLSSPLDKEKIAQRLSSKSSPVGVISLSIKYKYRPEEIKAVLRNLSSAFDEPEEDASSLDKTVDSSKASCSYSQPKEKAKQNTIKSYKGKEKDCS